VDPEETPVDQADALAALVAPQVTRATPDDEPPPPQQAPAPPEQAPAPPPEERPEPAPEPPAAAVIIATPPIIPAAPAAKDPGAPGPRGDGEYFQPVPSAQLVDGWRLWAAGERREGIDVVAPEGTPVHAVAGGTVVAAERSGQTMQVQGDDGRRYAYMGLRDGSLTVATGQRIEAGRILGAVGGTVEPPHLHLEINDPDGSPINPYELLLGLPDPNELGYGAVGLGTDIDPYPTDGEAAGPDQGAGG
jgi:murein DD-endopeptidase MepM/ murein hydrolase activator NlpD